MLLRDRPEFESELKALEGIFSRKLDDEQMVAYWNALQDLPLPTFKRKCQEHLKRGKFFPKPAELRPKGEAEEPGVMLSADGKHSLQVALIETCEKDRANNDGLRDALIRNAQNLLEVGGLTLSRKAMLEATVRRLSS